MKKIRRDIGNFIYHILFYLFSLFPVKNNKIFIQNFNGKGYGDNPKYIVEELLRHGFNFDLVWAANPDFNASFPEGTRTVPYKSLKAVYEEATAKIWIDNCRKQPYVRKRKNQFYIQTWHDGCIPLKKAEKDAENTLDPYYLRHAKRDSKLVDLFLSNSDFYTKLYRSSFWYGGDILECGSPRDDLFFTGPGQIKEKICVRFSFEKDTKIILYAPTFRDVFDFDCIDIDYQSIINLLRENTGEKWIFFVRLHPNILEKADCINYNDSVINMSNYNDMQELMYASDILISDYSGVMIEFALTKKPVFIYAKDYASYLKERDFYVDFSTLPFPAAADMETLLYNIAHFSESKYSAAVQGFFQRFGIFEDGKASERVADRICKIINSRS
jgi:CDP-glycerol glycerophosphotransferase